MVAALEAVATWKVRGGGWALETAMYGSGQRHEAWVFRRGPDAVAPYAA